VALTESLDDESANSAFSFTFDESAVFDPKAEGRLGLPIIVEPVGTKFGGSDFDSGLGKKG